MVTDPFAVVPEPSSEPVVETAPQAETPVAAAEPVAPPSEVSPEQAVAGAPPTLNPIVPVADDADTSGAEVEADVDAEEPDAEPEPEPSSEPVGFDGIVPMTHPDGGTCDLYEVENGKIMVPTDDVATMLAHGFVVDA